MQCKKLKKNHITSILKTTESKAKFTKVKHKYWLENDIRQKQLQYIFEKSWYDKDLILTFLAENWNMDLKLKSYIVWKNWYRDIGLCQINIGYHPKIVKHKDFFTFNRKTMWERKTESERIELKFPMPLSINIAFAWYKKRHKSNEYLIWENKAREYLEDQQDYKIFWDEWLEVEYNFYFPIYNKDWTKKKKDVFNFEKVLSDFLVKIIPWFEDEKILIWKVQKIDSTRNEVEIIIREIL